MTETYTGGSVKISCPSNYAENRRGAEVTLQYALPEGTTCEQADEATRRVRMLCLKHVIAAQSGEPSGSLGEPSPAASAKSKLPVAAPEKIAEPKNGANGPATSGKLKPSEITIGWATAAPTTASAPIQAPVVAVQTALLPAQQAPAFVMPDASPSIPASTGTEAGSAPPFVVTPTTSGPAVVEAGVVSPSDAPASATVGGMISAPVDGIDDLGLRKLVAREITRINQLAPGQGGNVVNSITAEFVSPPGGLLSIPQADRERFVATLAAWHGGTA